MSSSAQPPLSTAAPTIPHRPFAQLLYQLSFLIDWRYEAAGGFDNPASFFEASSDQKKALRQIVKTIWDDMKDELMDMIQEIRRIDNTRISWRPWTATDFEDTLRTAAPLEAEEDILFDLRKIRNIRRLLIDLMAMLKYLKNPNNTGGSRGAWTWPLPGWTGPTRLAREAGIPEEMEPGQKWNELEQQWVDQLGWTVETIVDAFLQIPEGDARWPPF